MEQENVSRRDFLTTGAVGTAALTLPAATYANIQGANDRIGVAFIGVGGRCQAHVDVILAMQRANANSVRPVGVCDVWDGDPRLGRRLALDRVSYAAG